MDGGGDSGSCDSGHCDSAAMNDGYAGSGSATRRELTPEEIQSEKKLEKFLALGGLGLLAAMTWNMGPSLAGDIQGQLTKYDQPALEACVNNIFDHPENPSRQFISRKASYCYTVVDRYLEGDNPMQVQENTLKEQVLTRLQSIRSVYGIKAAPETIKPKM